jgi:type I restriction enzyme R subunit
LEFRENIEQEHQQGATDIGLSETEYAFHNILMAEVTKQKGDDSIDETTHRSVIEVVKHLVEMMEDATSIVEFFRKQDEVKRVRKNIKRTILDEDFGNRELVTAITDRFMELAKVKFK